MTLLKIPGIERVTGNDAPVDREQSLRQGYAARYEENLYAFMKAGWKYIDPNPFSPGWHMEAIAEHLEAVADGHIRRLIINQPPRTSKSSMLVAFDAWVWAQPNVTPTAGPGVQFLHASYAQTLSIRDSLKTRRLIESPWYQGYWGDNFKITSDQNTKIRFENSAGGYRLATSVGGALTGEGGSIILIDDPHNAVEMESELVRQGTINWFDNSLSTRLNNAKTGAMILVMQRLHEDDLTGHILARDYDDWVHLMLPMRYDSERAKIIYPNIIGWSDPRTYDGELLAPDRFDEQAVNLLERQLGPYGASGQLQQSPSPKGGGIIKRDYWEPWDQEAFPAMKYIIASVDTAYGTKQFEGDFSAITVWGVWDDTGAATGLTSRTIGPNGEIILNRVSKSEDGAEVPRIMLMNAWQGRVEFHALVEKIAEIARKMKVDTVLIENKAAGISVAQEIRRLYGHEDWGVIFFDPKSQDKVARTYSIQHLFAEGLIMAPLERAWADMVVTQSEQFPKGKHDDLHDTVTQALSWLRSTGMIERGAERTAALANSKMFRSNAQDAPLYPV